MEIATSEAQGKRAAYLGGLAIAIGGAVLFSTKAIVAKLLYRYHLDAVTVIAFRMLFSLPVFAAIALWKMRTAAPLSRADAWRLVGLGLVGYYLSSYLDFLGLQFITVGLERLILFLTPTFVLLGSALWLKKHIGRSQWLSLLTAYAGIVLVFFHDLWQQRGPGLAAGAGCPPWHTPLYLLASGEMVKRLGSLRLVSYAMCVLQRGLHRPILPAAARRHAGAADGGVRPVAGERYPVHG